VRDVLASQSLAMNKLKVLRIWVDGQLQAGVFAKDLVLHVIRTLGVKGGVGYAYEFAGPAIEALSMEERMTLCNMAIEGGARCGYVNPDPITFAYLQGRPFAPGGEAWERAVAWWSSLASGPDAVFDDEVRFDAAAIAPTVTWGITPGQGIGVDEAVPTLEQTPPDRRHARGCVLHRQLHQRPPQRPAGCRRRGQRASGGGRDQGLRGARQRAGGRGGRGRRARSGVCGSWLRVA
jgi:3-isopropylmalate/(R)-2-methylmalate dehydratase large subunit